MLQTIFRFCTQNLAAGRETNLKEKRQSKIPLLFENRFYALFWKSVKWYFSAVVNIHASQIDYYEKQLDVHQSFFKSLRLIAVSLKCEIVLFFEGQQVFISVELS